MMYYGADSIHVGYFAAVQGSFFEFRFQAGLDSILLRTIRLFLPQGPYEPYSVVILGLGRLWLGVVLGSAMKACNVGPTFSPKGTKYPNIGYVGLKY